MSKEKNSILDRVPFLQKLKNIKHIEYIIIGIFVVILAVIYMSSTSKSNSNSATNAETSLEEYGNYLETKLKNVLGDIKGVGSVSVMITFNGRITYEYATETEETTTTSSVTSGSNTKTVTKEEVILINKNGQQVPIIVKEVYPEIAGVVIVASGAKDVSVRLNIISATTTLFDISDNNIQVLIGENN